MDDLRDIWQTQEVDRMQMSVEELRAKAAKFHGRIRARNLREQLACLVVVVAFGAMFFKVHETVPRIAFLLTLAGAIYVAWHLQFRGAAKALPAELGRASGTAFYRCELERQRDLLREVWKWYLGPLLPGLALFVVWGIIVAPPDRRWFPITYAVFASLFVWLVVRLNRRAASRFKDEIEELDGEAGRKAPPQ